MKNKIAITGASGFIGSHVVREFNSHGLKPLCLLRDPTRKHNLMETEIDTVQADLYNTLSLSKALHGCSSVIHIAARVSDWGSLGDFETTNILGTMNLLKACKDNGIRQIVLTGTNSAYGEENSRLVKNENSTFRPRHPYFMGKAFPSAMNHYRLTKTEAVRQACTYCEEQGMNLTVLEPVWVFGEREFSSGFYEYLKGLETGLAVAPGSRKNKFHVIYAGDLAHAYYLAWKKNKEGIHRYLIGNPDATNMAKIYGMFCQAAGMNFPLLLPKFLIYPVAFFLELFSTLTKSVSPPLLTRARINMFYDNIEYSVEKAKTDLGFSAKANLKEAIEQTVKWYQNEGYLRGEGKKK